MGTLVKGIPDVRGFYWVKWFVPSWMDKPTIETAWFHKGGMSFFSDERNATLEVVQACCMCYERIPFPDWEGCVKYWEEVGK